MFGTRTTLLALALVGATVFWSGRIISRPLERRRVRSLQNVADVGVAFRSTEAPHWTTCICLTRQLSVGSNDR